MVGCDGRMNSDLSDDNCGVCGGNGRSCRQIANTYRGYIKEKRRSKELSMTYEAMQHVACKK